DDGLAGDNLDALAAMHQGRGVMAGPENLSDPDAQRGFVPSESLMRRDNLVLAPLQRTVQFGYDAHLLRDELTRSQGFFGSRRKMHQHQFDPPLLGAPLDLRETVGRR